jgi:hypothetical protein
MAFEFLKPYVVDSKIRLGRLKDGGYVLEDNSLDHIDLTYSYGVGWEVSFEKALYLRTKKIIRAFDPSMFDVSNIPQETRRGAFWITKYLAKVVYFATYLLALPIAGYKIKFYNEGLARRKEYKYNSFGNHLKRFGDEGKKVLLKIDIEGSEYELFSDEGFQKSLDNVVQIAMEFHDLQDHLGDLENLVNRLSDRFSVVHFHANNFGGVFEARGKKVPRTIELTFLNNAFLKDRTPDESPMPVEGLDYPNDLSRPDIELSQIFK